MKKSFNLVAERNRKKIPKIEAGLAQDKVIGRVFWQLQNQIFDFLAFVKKY